MEYMFERFTDRARKVMALANQEAQRFNHEYVGTEHLLLGLLVEGSGVGANYLKSEGIDITIVREEIDKLVRTGPDMVSMGKLPYTPRAKNVLKYGVEEAQKMGHNYFGTEHMLLGILREHDGVGAQVLINRGLSLDACRAGVFKLLGVEDKAIEQPNEEPQMTSPVNEHCECCKIINDDFRALLSSLVVTADVSDIRELVNIMEDFNNLQERLCKHADIT